LRVRTPAGEISIAEASLLPHKGHPVVAALLNLRLATKMATFVDSYQLMTTDLDPYLRPHLKLGGTETGRLACSDPNLQNVPRVGPIKLVFQSRWHEQGGTMGLVDLSQAELRVVAMLSGDRQLAKALAEQDVHRYIASMVFGLPQDQITALQRKKSKGVTFGLLYGGSPHGLADRVGVEEAEVVKIVKGFFSAFPQLARWLKTTGDAGVNNLYIETLFGRRRDLSLLMAKEKANSVRRKSVNTPVQSVASDIMLVILQGIIRGLLSNGMKSRTLFTVHDSTIMEIYPGEEMAVIDVVGAAFKRLQNTPLRNMALFPILPILGEFKVADSWAEVESTNEHYDYKMGAEFSSLDGTVSIHYREREAA
jgi:DNA polymerase-1